MGHVLRYALRDPPNDHPRPERLHSVTARLKATPKRAFTAQKCESRGSCPRIRSGSGSLGGTRCSRPRLPQREQATNVPPVLSVWVCQLWRRTMQSRRRSARMGEVSASAVARTTPFQSDPAIPAGLPWSNAPTPSCAGRLVAVQTAPQCRGTSRRSGTPCTTCRHLYDDAHNDADRGSSAAS